MAKKAYEIDDIQQAVSASNSLGLIKGNKINGTGYGRARFIFSFNLGTATTGSLSAGGYVYKAATSSGTYSQVSGTSVAAVSAGVMSSATPIIEIDVPIDPTKPWMQLSSFSIVTTGLYHSVIVQLYKGINRPGTSDSVQQTVTI